MSFKLQVNGTVIEVTSNSESPAVYNVFVDVIRIEKINTALGFTESETVLHTNMPATIKWSSGKEALKFDKQTWYRDATLRCRFCDIDVKDRVRHNGQDFEIIDVVDWRNLGKLLVIGLKRIE